jgi:hypothetical protein
MRPSAPSVVLLAMRLLWSIILVVAPGCVTPALMERWDALDRPSSTPAATAPARPTALLRAVRTSEGRLYVLALCSDGTRRPFVADALEPAPVTSGAWPRASTGDEPPALRPHVGDLPEGAPIACEPDEALPPGDPELEALLHDDGARARLRLWNGHEVQLLVEDEEPVVIARVVHAPARSPPPSDPPSTARRLGLVALLPFALVADVAIGAVVVGAYVAVYAGPALLAGCH